MENKVSRETRCGRRPLIIAVTVAAMLAVIVAVMAAGGSPTERGNMWMSRRGIS